MKKLLAIFFLFLITITCSVNADMVNDMYYYTYGDTLSYGGTINGIAGLSNSDYNAFLGFYDEQGMLCAERISVSAEDEKLNVPQQNIKLFRTPGKVMAKLMLWSDYNSYMPLADTSCIQQSIGIETRAIRDACN